MKTTKEELLIRKEELEKNIASLPPQTVVTDPTRTDAEVLRDAEQSFYLLVELTKIEMILRKINENNC